MSEKESFIEMVRVGFESPEEKAEYETDKVNINKQMSRITSKARERAKKDSCEICKKKCTSFCDSHSVPRFVLRNISENGKVCLPLQGDIAGTGTDTGINKAGTFNLICNECDSTIFQLYEDPDAYTARPTDKMLAQIAMKNNLQMISKRYVEHEIYGLLSEMYPNNEGFAQEKQIIGQFDLDEFKRGLNYAKNVLKMRFGTGYYLCYYKKLDYVVPYAAQSGIALLADFDGNVINNVFDFKKSNRLKYIQVAIFPFQETSIVLLFVEEGEKAYRKFYRQLNKLPLEDQLATINYMVFAYTENVFLHTKTFEAHRTNPKFKDVCRKITDYTSPIPFLFDDPLDVAVNEFSLSKRHDIPNLLSKEYALK